MSSRVVVALRIKASPERVFEAFTTEIAIWWRPNGLFAFTPRSPVSSQRPSGPSTNFSAVASGLFQ